MTKNYICLRNSKNLTLFLKRSKFLEKHLERPPTILCDPNKKSNFWRKASIYCSNTWKLPRI